MKINIYNAISIAAMASSIAACQEPENPYQDLFPEEYQTILYIKGDNMTPLDLPDLATSNEYIYGLSVIKAGSKPDNEAAAELRIMTQEEITARYGKEYSILPQDTWSIGSTGMHFSAEEKNKDFEVTFIPKKIKSLIDDTDKKFCVAFQLISQNDSVNANKNTALISIKSVTAPRLNFVEPDRVIVFKSKNDTEAKINISTELAGISTNPWNFTCKASPSTDVKFMDMFYDKFGFEAADVNATPLAASFSSDKFEFIKNDSFSQEKISVTVNPKNLEEGKLSVLPIVLSESSMEGILSPDEVRYISAIIPKQPEKVSLSKDMMYSTHGHSVEGTDLGALLDENPNTFWHADYDNVVQCAEGLGFEIDLTKTGKMYHSLKIGYHTRLEYSINPSMIVLYGSSNNGEDWFEINTLTMKEDGLPSDDNKNYESMVMYSLQGFNRLKFAVPESYNKHKGQLLHPGSGDWGTYVITDFRLWAN